MIDVNMLVADICSIRFKEQRRDKFEMGLLSLSSSQCFCLGMTSTITTITKPNCLSSKILGSAMDP